MKKVLIYIGIFFGLCIFSGMGGGALLLPAGIGAIVVGIIGKRNIEDVPKWLRGIAKFPISLIVFGALSLFMGIGALGNLDNQPKKMADKHVTPKKVEVKADKVKEVPKINLVVSNTINTTTDKTHLSGYTESGAKVELIEDGKTLNSITTKDGKFDFIVASEKDRIYTVRAESSKEGVKPDRVTVHVFRKLSEAEQKKLQAEQEAKQKAEFEKQCQEIPYKQLKKDPDKYAGTKYKVRGQIVQIMEDSGVTVMRVAVTKDPYIGWDFNDIVYVEYLGTTSHVEDDVVTIYGTVSGSQTYTSQAGWEITVPGVVASYIE